jgi:hypothetical protein
MRAAVRWLVKTSAMAYVVASSVLPIHSAIAQGQPGQSEAQGPAGKAEERERLRHNQRFGRAGSVSHAATSSLLSGGGGWLALPYDQQEAQQAMPPRPEQAISVIERPRFLDTLREYLNGSAAEKMQDATIDYKVGKQNLAWALTNPAAAQAIQAAVSTGYDSASYLGQQQEAFIEYLKEFDPNGRAVLEFQGCMAKQKKGSGAGGGQRKNDMGAFVACVRGSDFQSTQAVFDEPNNSGNTAFKPEDAWRISEEANPRSGVRDTGVAANRQGFIPAIGAGVVSGAFDAGAKNTLVNYALGDHVLGNSGTGGNQKQALYELRKEIRDYIGDIRYTSETTQLSPRKGNYVRPNILPEKWIPELRLENYKALFSVMEAYCKFRRENAVNGQKNVKPLEKVSFWAAIGGGSGGGSVNIDPKVLARLHAGSWAFTPVLGDMLFELYQRQTIDRDLDCTALKPPNSFPKDIDFNAGTAAFGGAGAVAVQQKQAYRDYLRAYVTYADLISNAQIYSRFAFLEATMIHFAVDQRDRADLTKEAYTALGVPDGAGILLAQQQQMAKLTEFAAALSQAIQTRVGIGSLLPETDNVLNRWGADSVRKTGVGAN